MQPRAIFLSYAPDAPSFRHRLRPALAALQSRGWSVEVHRLPRGRYVRRIFALRRELRDADVVVVAKIKPAPGEAPLLRRWSRSLVFDFDDAIWLRRPRRPGAPAQATGVARRKFDSICAAADLTIAGNEVLAERARPVARRVEIVPTPVDVDRYPAPDAARPGNRPPVLVWIGMPENVAYLDTVRPALETAAAEHPGLTLRVVSSQAPSWNGSPLRVEHVPWSRRAEIPALVDADAGLMPLTDDPWTRGKCAFKLLQYMAAGLPCIASPVGANLDAVEDGATGILAGDVEAWTAALRTLLADPDLRRRMGRAGRVRVEERYARAVLGPRTAALLEEVAGVSAPDFTAI